MAGAKEIRGKIASIKNTQKITKAMEMVAASKMRKAQDRMRAARPYAQKIRKIVGHLRQVNLDYKHPFTLERPVHSVGIIVISTDRGLAGSLNLNLFKAALGAIREAQAAGAKVYVCAIGVKALQFFRRLARHRTVRFGHSFGRQAARQGSARPHQGHARFLSRHQGRSAAAGAQRVRQHHDPKGRGVAAAAARDHRQGANCRSAGITSTSRMRSRFSTEF